MEAGRRAACRHPTTIPVDLETTNRHHHHHPLLPRWVEVEVKMDLEAVAGQEAVTETTEAIQAIDRAEKGQGRAPA